MPEERVDELLAVKLGLLSAQGRLVVQHQVPDALDHFDRAGRSGRYRIQHLQQPRLPVIGSTDFLPDNV